MPFAKVIFAKEKTWYSAARFCLDKKTENRELIKEYFQRHDITEDLIPEKPWQ